MANNDDILRSQVGTDRYEGAETLQIMEAATNYNAALFDLVIGHAPASGTVLDFGAGLGNFARRLAASRYRVRCIEPDSALREKIADSGLVVDDSLARIEQSSIDYVYTLNVLEHIEDDRCTLADLRDRLRAGGRLLIYVPAFPLLYSHFDRAVGHVRRYRLRPLTDLLQQTGWHIEEARYCDSLGFFVALLAKQFGDRDGTLGRRELVFYDRVIFPLSRVLDRLCGKLFGKNLLVVALRAES